MPPIHLLQFLLDTQVFFLNRTALVSYFRNPLYPYAESDTLLLIACGCQLTKPEEEETAVQETLPLEPPKP
jgi:hypothetical protein